MDRNDHGLIRFLLIFLIVVVTFIRSGATPAVARSLPVQPQTWLPVNGPLTPGGEVGAMAQSQSDPNTLFVLVNGLNSSRLYRSADRSDHWSLVYQFDSLMNDLAIDPDNSSVVYTGSSAGLFRSTDGGAHWDLFNTLGVQFAVPAPNSVDTVGKADQKPASCVDSEFTFAWTTNGGTSWNSSDLGCYSGVNQVEVSKSQNNTVYVSVSRFIPNSPVPEQEADILKSLDGGQTWQSYYLPSEYHCVSCATFIIDPLNSQHLFGSVEGSFMTSADGGQTWVFNSSVSLGAFSAVKLAVSGSDLYAFPDTVLSGSVFLSQDGGSSWWQSAGILPAGGFSLLVDTSQPGRLYVGLDGYGVYRSDNAGSTWTEANQGIQTPARVTALAVAPSNPLVIYAASDYPRPALFSTQDGGQTWSLPLLDTQYNGPFRKPGVQGARIMKIAIHPKDPTTVWAGGDAFYANQKGNGWYPLFNFGLSDLKVSPTFPDHPFAAAGDGIAYVGPSFFGPPGFLQWYFHSVNGLYPIALAINPSQANTILVASNLSTNFGIAIDIYSTSDNGLTYQKLSEIPADNMIENLEISPSNASMVIATTRDTRYISQFAMVSRDGGKSWTSWTEGLQGGGADSFLAVDANSVAYFGGLDGVYIRTSNGATWMPIGLQNQAITAMALFAGNPEFLLTAINQGLFKLNLMAYSLWLPFTTRS